jgi:hypothetical protein
MEDHPSILILTQHCTLLYRDFKVNSIFPPMPRSSNRFHINDISMVAYARLQSMKAAYVESVLAFLVSMMEVTVERLSMVQLFLLKPF